MVLACLAACHPDPHLAPLQPDAKVLAFGDSLTLGTGVAPGRAYPAILGELSGRTVINAGVAGEETGEGLKRLPELLRQHAPELVIVMHGGNDLLRRRDQLAIKRNLATMIEQVQASGSDVLLVSVPEPRLLLRPAELYAELAKDYQVPLEGKILTQLQGKPAMKSDQVHFNADGYQLLAEAIATKLQDSGAL
jgi:lysophospholipase L1-like esterase